MFEEQDGEMEYETSFPVNRWDVLAVLLSTATGLIGVVAGMFGQFTRLTHAHANYVDGVNEFQAEVAQDIERLTGGE